MNEQLLSDLYQIEKPINKVAEADLQAEMDTLIASGSNLNVEALYLYAFYWAKESNRWSLRGPILAEMGVSASRAMLLQDAWRCYRVYCVHNYLPIKDFFDWFSGQKINDVG